MPMKLYDFPFSPNCRKVRAVAYELELRIDLEPVDLLAGAQRAPAFVALNPNGAVPVLVDGDMVLWESNAIITYLADKSGSALTGRELRDRAEIARWLCWQLASLGPAMRKVAFERIVKPAVGRGEPDAARVAEGTAEFATHSAVLDGWLASRDYVAGRLSVADFALAAHYSLAGACGLELAEYPRVSAWLDRMSARPSLRQALADARLPTREAPR